MRSESRGRTSGGSSRRTSGRRFRRFEIKKCRFCGRSGATIDYKDAELLKKFITERGKILPSRITGNCAKHQRQVMRAVKRARLISLLPFAAE